MRCLSRNRRSQLFDSKGEVTTELKLDDDDDQEAILFFRKYKVMHLSDGEDKKRHLSDVR